MGLKPDPERLGRKLEMYRTPFAIRTPAIFYAGLGSLYPDRKKELLQTVRSDLARFIGAELIEHFEQKDFSDLLGAVQQAFQEILSSKKLNFDGFRKKTGGAK
jgi:hypothetical protein